MVNRVNKMLALSCAAAGFVVAGGVASGTAYTGTPDPVGPAPGSGIPTVRQVRGKEVSFHFDRAPGSAGGALTPEQVIAFDGIGGTAPSFNYAGSRAGDGTRREVDAISNSFDALFGALQADRAALLWSTDSYPTINAEKIAVPVSAVWATPKEIDDMSIPDAAGVAPDVDGVEVWGGDIPGNDANRYSLEGDSVFAPSGVGTTAPVSVWSFSPGAGTSAALWFKHTLAAAIAPLAPPVLLPPEFVKEEIFRQFDLDGMMTGGSDLITFTIDPIHIDGCHIAGMDSTCDPTASLGPVPAGFTLFDGGEIFTYTRGDASAAFLFHGGHLWDTLFPVAATYGTPSENVNALEAVSVVPLPLGVWAGLAVLGGLGVAKKRRSA